MATPKWSADVAVSTPEPLDHTERVPMGGFCMTANGMAFDLTSQDLESLGLTLPDDDNG